MSKIKTKVFFRGGDTFPCLTQELFEVTSSPKTKLCESVPNDIVRAKRSDFYFLFQWLVPSRYCRITRIFTVMIPFDVICPFKTISQKLGMLQSDGEDSTFHLNRPPSAFSAHREATLGSEAYFYVLYQKWFTRLGLTH